MQKETGIGINNTTIKAVMFDFGHTIQNELKHRDKDLSSCPIEVMPGVRECLREISLAKCIWANTRSATSNDVRSWLQRARLDDFFNHVITSADIGVRKPQKEFFEISLLACGYDKYEVLFVGNQLNTDIKGANEFGIKNVFLSSEVYHSQDDDDDLNGIVIPTLMTRSLSDLPMLIDTITRDEN